MIITKKKRWWALFTPSEATHTVSWAPQKKCTETVQMTGSQPHACDTKGEHWQHTCSETTEEGDTCGFRWAK